MYNKLKIISAAIICCLAFVSCNDSDLAKQMDGTWLASYKTDEDGTRQKVKQTMTFQYDAEDEENDGTFVEEISGVLNETDPKAGTVQCKYRSRIEGTWIISFGDLCLEYDVRTLKVEVDSKDVKVNPTDLKAQMGMAAINMLGMDITKSLANEIRNNLRENLAEHYEDEAPYGNLKVSDTEMSFESDDLGRITFHRIK